MEDRTAKVVVETITHCINLAETIDELKDTPFYSQQIKNLANKFQKALDLKVSKDFKAIGLDKSTALQLAENIDKRNDLLKVITKMDNPMVERVTVYADSLLYGDENIESQDVAEVKDDYENPLEAELSNIKSKMGVSDTKKINIDMEALSQIPMNKAEKDEQKRNSEFRAAVVNYAKQLCGEGNWKFVDYYQDKGIGTIIVEFKDEKKKKRILKQI